MTQPVRQFLIAPFLTLLIVLSSIGPALGEVVALRGLDPANMDLSADPADDFYRFANGGWLDRTEIPDSESMYGVFTELENLTHDQLLAILEGASASGTLEAGTDPWKATEMFRQGMDMEARNAQGVVPIQSILDDIAAIQDMDDFQAFHRLAMFSGLESLFGVDVDPDLRDNTMHSVYLGTGYLGLPNRDYYLDEDEDTLAIRDAYIATSAELLGYLGYDEVTARSAAEAVYTLEHSLAAATMTREDEQDFELSYNPRNLQELTDMYPLMDWDAYLAALGLTAAENLIVTDVGYFEALADIVADTPVDVLKSYLELELIWGTASFLSEEVGATTFAFYGGVLSGVTERRPLDERVLSAVNGSFGDAVGQLYVEAYFPPEAKQEITDLVDALIVSFGRRIDANPWMSEETKVKAHEKLDGMTVKVGYPEVWETYDGAEVGDSYFSTAWSVMEMDTRHNLAQFGEPVDTTKWDTPAQTVNAFYNSIANEIVFPAAILQAPFFDYQADPALNFGGIGYVIGHEITHGFDLQGSQFDARGNLSDWWAEDDYDRFMELNDELASQYSAIEVLPGYHVNGMLTVTENAADLGGLQVAYDALQIHLAAEGQLDSLASPVVTGLATPVVSPMADIATLTPQQAFFISAATIWRGLSRDEALIYLLRVDSHSPSAVRAVLPAQNMDAFYEAFDIGPDDAMYLAPEDRLVIW